MDTQGIQATGIPARVTGWLLVLCLLLTFMYPATSLYCIFSYAIPKLIEAQLRNPAMAVCRERRWTTTPANWIAPPGCNRSSGGQQEGGIGWVLHDPANEYYRDVSPTTTVSGLLTVKR
jgi:hypothetical protein